MLGLALGAILVGRRVDASRQPLRWYGILEIGIGVYALLFPTLIRLLGDGLFGSPWIGAFLLLVLPAALMGGTLPVLARAAADTTRRGTRALGILYGINTIGAVAGALLTVLVWLERFGLHGTTNIAAILNLLLGLTFWGLSSIAGERPQFPAQGILEDEAARSSARGGLRMAVIAAFFAAGLAGLALEVAWTRLLVYSLEGFTIAFGLMLAAYLLGLGTGSLAGTWFALRSRNPRRLLSRVLMVEGLLALGTFLLVGPLGASLEEMRAGYVGADAIDFGYGASLFQAALAIVFPATFCGGMLLPIVARMMLIDRESIGRQTGVVYAASTLGAVIAPPLAGFVLLPLLGVPRTIAVAALLVVVAGLALVGRKRSDWVPAGVAIALFFVLYFAADLGRPLIERSYVFAGAREPKRLLAHRTGSLADVSVVEEVAAGTRRLYIDGFSAAETGRNYGYMRMLGHLPVLLHPDPKSVCVIAFGTGTTAGAVAAHPEVERLVCVEIEPEVFAVADRFRAANRGVLEDARTEQVVADGREYVRRGEERFDVITLEPLMPYTPAAVYLYTREFYEDARKSLAPGGLLCQWIPPQGVSVPDLRRLIKSVATVFPHTSVWYFEHAVLVVAGDPPQRPDLSALVRRCSTREIARDLEWAHVGDAAHLLGSHVVSGQALLDMVADDEPMVDDRTDLEFRPLPRRFGKRSQRYHAQNLALLASAHQERVSWLEAVGPEVDLALRSTGAALRSLATEMDRRVAGGLVVPASDLREVLAADPDAVFAQAITHRRLYRELFSAGRFDAAIQLKYAPDRSAALLALAEREEGEQRRYYLILALRENSLLGGNPMRDDAEANERALRLLRELADSFEGPQKLFCENRVRILAGEAPEEGEEALPGLELPDVRGPLDAGDFGLARARLEAARAAGLAKEADRQAWLWWQEAEDQRAAFRGLFEAGSSFVLRAALKLYARETPDDLEAVAGYFCEAYPRYKQWQALCEHILPRVREAAANEAKQYGNKAHAEVLARLCADRFSQVRLSAWIALRDIVPDVEASGYDYRKPTPEALAAIAKLIE